MSGNRLGKIRITRSERLKSKASLKRQAKVNRSESFKKDLTEVKTVIPYLKYSNQTPVIRFLSTLFSEHELTSEFCFCRDFHKCQKYEKSSFLAYAHLLDKKYLIDDCYHPLNLDDEIKQDIRNTIWLDPDGSDPYGLVTPKIFDPIYHVCLVRINGVYSDFASRYPIEDLFDLQPKEKQTSSPLMSMSSSPEDWSIKDVSRWLRINGLAEYIDKFRKAKINGNKLIELNSEQLTQYRVSQLDQSRLQDALSQYN